MSNLLLMSRTVKKTSLNLDESLMLRAQHYSIDSGKTVSQLMELALDEYMKNHPLKKER